MKSYYLTILGCIAAVSGCTLEDVVDYGDPCKDAEYVLLEAERCDFNEAEPSKDCAESLKALKVGRCPNNYACGTDASDAPYCHIKCPKEQIFCSDACIDPLTSNKFCGAKGNCFSENVSSDDYTGAACTSDSICQNGVCKANTRCPAGQHEMKDGTCEDDSFENCGVWGFSCHDINIQEGQCVNGNCVPERCMTGFHLIKDRCVIDKNDCCGDGCIDCGDEVCSEGKCIPLGSSCAKDEHRDDTGECVKNTVDACGTLNCTTLPGWSEGECKVDKCWATECSKGTHLIEDSGQCELDTSSCCGADCKNCGDKDCVEGVCALKACEDNEHYDVNTSMCVTNTVNACGTIDCTKLPGWDDGVCDVNQCKATSCRTGSHLNPDTNMCDTDSNACCGAECTTCVDHETCIQGSCKLTGCDSGEDLCTLADDSKECRSILSDVENCGQCNRVCSTYLNTESTVCDDGKCTYTCKSGYEQCGSDQTPDCRKTNGTDPSNCGSCQHACASTEYCNGGKCVPNNCDLGTHRSASGECVKDSPTECGGNLTDCEKEDPNALSVLCENGICKAKTCNSNYHVSADWSKCEPDSADACGSATNNCNAIAHKNAVSCKSSSCYVTTCETGYHPDSSHSACEGDTPSVCGNSRQNCGTNDACNTYQCNNGTCSVTCNNDCHKNGSSCEADSVAACGSSTNNCNAIEHRKDVGCDSGKCTVLSCETGYHPNSSKTACDKDSTAACGYPVKDCSSSTNCPANASCSCSSGNCVFTCGSNYHKNGSVCEKDSVTACGSATNNCNAIEHRKEVSCVDAKCVLSTCETGWHPNNTNPVCDKDSATACGNPAKDCTSSANCPTNATCSCTSSGTCTFNCGNNYHKNSYGTGCEANTVRACGSYNNNCTTKAGWSMGACINGQCIPVLCKNEYFLTNDAPECIQMTASNGCGSSATCDPNSSYYAFCDIEYGVGVCSTTHCDNGNTPRMEYRYMCGTEYYNSKFTYSCFRHDYQTCNNYSTCSAGTHPAVSGYGCNSDTTYSCGADGYVCQMMIPGWNSGECLYDYEGAVCSVTSCKSGYKVVETGYSMGGKKIQRCEPTFAFE